MVLLALPPADHLPIERDRGQFVPSRRRRHDGQRPCRTFLKIPAEPSPELRIPGAAAQTRVVSLAGIRLGSWESARARLVSFAHAERNVEAFFHQIDASVRDRESLSAAYSSELSRTRCHALFYQNCER